MCYYRSNVIVMSQPWDKILLYENRSVSACIEATFDFLRQNRRVWFCSAFALFLPWSLLLGLSAFMLPDDSLSSGLMVFDQLFCWQEDYRFFFSVVVFVGVWMAFVHVYSLLTSYHEHENSIDGFTQRQMMPIYARMSVRTFWLAALAFNCVLVLFISTSFLSLLSLFILIPLSLLPSVFLFERESIVGSFVKAFRLGFRAWFQLFLTLVLMMLFGFFMTMVIGLPSSLFGTALGLLTSTGEPEGLLTGFFSYLLMALSYFAFFLVVSMTLMAAAYQYGTVSERVDDTSVESDIQHFEQL